jgi:hypothetical protein
MATALVLRTAVGHKEDVSKWSDKLDHEGDFFFFPFFFY